MVFKAKTETFSYDKNLDIETKHGEERLILCSSIKLTVLLQTILVTIKLLYIRRLREVYHETVEHTECF